jgi:hypothetical protein
VKKLVRHEREHGDRDESDKDRGGAAQPPSGGPDRMDRTCDRHGLSPLDFRAGVVRVHLQCRSRRPFLDIAALEAPGTD